MKYFFFGLLFLAACTKKQVDLSTLSPEDLSARGKSIYEGNCIACHNLDPNKDGTVGPAIAGSSKELVTARVLKASYPDGYKSKRDTKVMPALPALENEIPAIHAYLNKK